MKEGNSNRDNRGGRSPGPGFPGSRAGSGPGSNYPAMPREVVQALAAPVGTSVRSRSANGDLEMTEVGATRIRLGGKQFTTPVIFAEKGEPSLLAVGPVNNSLIPVVAKG